MRNLFDQYQHHENRLTHALVSCLNEDRDLLESFVRWVLGSGMPRSRKVHIVEQQLPGEEQIPEQEAERRGLPDGWIFNESGWALLIESKISSAIDAGQLKRHLRMAERRGFTACHVLLLSVVKARHSLPDRTVARQWTDVYQWASKEASHGTWARRLVGYMNSAEGRMLADGYLKDGTLTTFTGIHFDADNPYSYVEAKRLLKLLMEKMRARQKLHSVLGADLEAGGRSAITGTKVHSVWDYIPFAEAQGKPNFTALPHLTLAIDRDRTIVQLTIPHRIETSYRKALIDSGYEGFKAGLNEFLTRIKPILDQDPTVQPFVAVLQRHYTSQRSSGVQDALLEFDLRTACGTHPKVKPQELWLKATFEVFGKRRSNLQLGLGLFFPYQSAAIVNTAEFVSTVEKTWLATQPLLLRMGLVEP